MRLSRKWIGAIISTAILASPATTFAQNKLTETPSATVTLPKDYPTDQPGMFIQSLGWISLPAAMPFKTHVKHAIAAYFSYGAVPAPLVADYAGPHAAVQIGTAQPVICICHLISLPGAPIIVRLHPKKNMRELDGGNMPILYGSKMIEAKKNDTIPVDVSQPESTVWLVRPRQDLPVGEYALMLGSQNIDVFPFTVSIPGVDTTGSPLKKK
ncbi:MAG TPA: hypothetical protein VJN21_12690 [Candidatus Acidoferrales bacterium]|nr:hypothetical protein [Candidatus Acidoferrales bacterium]